MFKIEIKEKKKSGLKKMKNIEKDIKKSLRDELFNQGMLSVRYTKKLIKSTKDKTGVITSSGHQRSAPGEAPANESGRLLKSIDYTVRNYTEMEFGDRIYYGKYLEDGTEKMKKRPHLLTTAKKRHGYIVRGLNQAFDKGSKK